MRLQQHSAVINIAKPEWGGFQTVPSPASYLLENLILTMNLSSL